MTLSQLHYVLALHRHGSYGRAAKATGVSQPAVSIQIKKLEEELELVLFDRSAKPVRATVAGLAFVEQAQVLLTQARRLRDLAAELRDEAAGELHLGIIPTLAPYLLPLFIDQLQQQFASLRLHVREALTEEILRDIREGKLDGGIISTPVESTFKVSVTPIFYEGFLLYTASSHALAKLPEVAIEAVAPDDVWMLREGNCFRDQVDNICEVQRGDSDKELFYFESTSIESLCRIVEFKGGLTFLPELATLSFSSEREELIKPLKGVPSVREISLVHLPEQARRGMLEQVAKVIQQNIPKRMLTLGAARAVPTKVRV